MLQGCGTHVALVLICASLICGVHSITIPSGREKDAWPELLNMQVEDAIAFLNSTGLTQNVYVQVPGLETSPANVVGKSSDVWLYTDGSMVYEIPRRGYWHPNRLVPGWPEVSGMSYRAAIAKIKQDYIGVTIIYGPKGSIARTADIRMDRVYVEINSDGMIAGVPSIG